MSIPLNSLAAGPHDVKIVVRSNNSLRSPACESLSLDAGTGPLHIAYGTCECCWRFGIQVNRRISMKLEWHKPEVTEQEVGLEVTSYAPAELDRT